MFRIKDYIKEYEKKNMFISLTNALVKWTILASCVGILTGLAAALFMKSLEWATKTRVDNPRLLYLLPLSGVIVSFMYYKYGKTSARGNNLIIDQINSNDEAIPLRMAPLVFFGTIMTHLFGGSAGREGTAVQMGAVISEFIGKIFRVDKIDRKILLICGISSGFGALFGTPLAGTVFGLEVVCIGIMNYEALIPCFVASFTGNIFAELMGIHHSHNSIGIIPKLDLIMILKVCIAGIIFGLASIAFIKLTSRVSSFLSKYIKNPMLKSAVGGFIVILLVTLVGTRDYLGLSLPLISDAFHKLVSPLTFLWKIIFTAVTLGSGFKGGEVTPLFAIGSSLGNSLSGLLNTSAPFLAGLGFIGVFCGATNTPITSFIMGMELFGSQGMVYMFITCIISYTFSGHNSIYVSQKLGVSKSKAIEVQENITLEKLSKL